MFSRLKNIQYIDVDGAIGNHSKGPCLVLLHGYGADAYDLQTLSDAFAGLGIRRFIFPQGFLEVPLQPGWNGRAWWQIAMLDWQKRVSQPGSADLSEYQPEGLALARKNMSEFLIALQEEQIILGGFSQGAMLATDLALMTEIRPKALLLLSGQMINRNEWKANSSKIADLPTFISHGDQDPVLPFSGASRLESFFRNSQAKVRTQFFKGMHEIPPEVISSARQFLQGLKKEE